MSITSERNLTGLDVSPSHYRSVDRSAVSATTAAVVRATR